MKLSTKSALLAAASWLGLLMSIMIGFVSPNNNIVLIPVGATVLAAISSIVYAGKSIKLDEDKSKSIVSIILAGLLLLFIIYATIGMLLVK